MARATGSGRRYLFFTLLLVAVVAAAVHFTAETPLLARGEPDKKSSSAAVEPSERKVTVAAQPVMVDTVTREIEAVGSLRSNESVVIQPEIAGRIAEIGFKEGEPVKQGALIVKLDSEILEAERAQAQANLTLSRANYTRADTLADQGTGSVQARDEALARLQADRAAVALAEARLDKATIEAPFSGVLGLSSVSPGEYVEVGARIVNLEDTDPIKVDFRVSEIFLPAVREGQPIEVQVDAFPGEVFEGTIYAIDPQVDVNGRAIHLRARIPNPEGRLQPGLFARVNVNVSQRQNAILIDEAAVVPSAEGKYVYRVVDGRAVRTPVEVGIRRPGQVEILKGLGPEAVVVVAGQQRLSDGAAVEIVQSPAES